MKAARHLGSLQPCKAVAAQVRRSQCRVRQLNRRNNPRAAQCVGHTENGRLGNARILEQHRLDFLGKHVEPRCHDHPPAAPGKKDPPLRVQMASVTDGQPAGLGPGHRLVAHDIPVEQQRTANPDLALFPGRKSVTVRSANLQLYSGKRPADPVAATVRSAAVRDETGLGRPVEFVTFGLRKNARDQFAVARMPFCAADQDPPQSAKAQLFPVAGDCQQAQLRRRGHEHRAPHLLHPPQDGQGLKTADHIHPPAAMQTMDRAEQMQRMAKAAGYENLLIGAEAERLVGKTKALRPGPMRPLKGFGLAGRA